MNEKTTLQKNALDLDWTGQAETLAAAIRRSVQEVLRRKGVVVALSGGIDSSLVGALCVRALGPERVFGLLMPEKDSSVETRQLSEQVARHLGIRWVCEDITAMLEAVGCYRRRNEAVRLAVPQFTDDCRCKIVLPSVMDGESFRVFSVVVQWPDGTQVKRRLTPEAYFGIVAATNFKQRVRKMLEYYHADRLHYAVTGTPNRQEYDQGFFVKLGDGAADVKPIAHLYKTQVYAMARALGIPEAICDRPPTTDTYPMEQSQEEFYFSVPYDQMDLCLFGKNQGFPPQAVTEATGLTAEQVERVYRDIDNKRRATRYLHLPPILAEPVEEISAGAAAIPAQGG